MERYTPYAPTNDPNALWLEFQRIAITLNAIMDGHIEREHIAPDNPQEGDFRFADGVDWNPGSGKGLYFYKDNAWNFIV